MECKMQNTAAKK